MNFHTKYNLYWVSTPCNYENWFVIAKSEKQAEKFHEYAEGFNSGYANAKFIKSISKELVNSYQIKEPDWPSLDLISELGGKIITSDNPKKVNFDGVVYQEGTCTESIFFEEFCEISGVYIIRVQNTDKYKIGITKNLKRRIKQFSTGNPENIKIDYFIATDHYKTLEKLLHTKVKVYCIGGEWFELDEKGLSKLMYELLKLIKDNPEEYDLYNLKAASIQARVY